MKKERYEEIRRKYIETYPHLAQIKNDRVFAQNVLRLAIPKTITGLELLDLSTLC